MYILGCKRPSKDDIEVAGGTAFQEIQPGAGFEIGDFGKEKLGGATVERLHAMYPVNAGAMPFNTPPLKANASPCIGARVNTTRIFAAGSVQ